MHDNTHELEILKRLDIDPDKPNFEGPYLFLGMKIHNSSCRLQMWYREGFAFVLFHDIGRGTSVTNAADQLIEEITAKYLREYDRDLCVFAETYNDKEGIDIIVPSWNGKQVEDVDWKHFGPNLRMILSSIAK
jgi:hypothetical protein